MQQLIESIELDQLPSLPQVLLRILRELNTETLQVSELSDCISQDTALTLKVLAVANSAAYRRQKQIISIEQGINMLGFKMVKTITVSASMQQFLSNLSGIVPLNFDSFWQHSLTTAFLSRMLAQSVGYPNIEEAYIAGLLHDVGKLVLLVTRASLYKELFQRHSEDDSHVEEEAKLLGITHSEVGAMLAQHWNLEPLIVDAIRHHHDPVHDVRNASELVKIVFLANALSKAGMGADHHPSLAVARAFFNMDAAGALRLVADANADVIALAVPLGVQIQDSALISQVSGDNIGAPESRALANQRQLAEEVRSVTMLNLAREDFDVAKSEDELLASILNSAFILFEPRQVFLFEWDAKSNLISGRPLLDQPDSISRIRFPLEVDKSLIADALLWDTMTHSFNRNSATVQSMMDEQIIRMANADGIFCVPMATKNFVYGVLVLAFPMGVVERQDSKLRFLTQFAREVADSIRKLRHELEVARKSDLFDLEAYKANARKIVHEVNNPLSILKNYLKILDLKLKNGQPAELEIQILNEEIDRVSSTIRKLAVPQEAQATGSGSVDVNAVIRGVLSICEPSLFSPSGIQVEARLDDNLPAIQSDPDSLKQVFINLFKNAAEAMVDGGVLTITTAPMVSQQQTSSISITISDNGPGIPQEILNNLFSPVKSTKGGDNAGLGLSITSNIISQLGGAIICKSAPKIGTTFEIVLPLKQKDSTAPKGNQISLPNSGSQSNV